MVELLCGSQPAAPTCVVWSWRLIDCFALTLAVKDFWDAGFHFIHSPNAFATLMGSNEDETAVCGCHYSRDMAVR